MPFWAHWLQPGRLERPRAPCCYRIKLSQQSRSSSWSDNEVRGSRGLKVRMPPKATRSVAWKSAACVGVPGGDGGNRKQESKFSRHRGGAAGDDDRSGRANL